MPRRRPGTLLPLESEILDAAVGLLRSGQSTFHGFGLAETMRTDDSSRQLVAHGTLYKALGRLEELGLVTSEWEQAPDGGRPRRRMYALTPAGKEAVRVRTVDTAPARRRPTPRPA